MQDDQDHFNILRTLDKVENPTAWLLAGKLGFSLGKLNYCIKELQTKGLIKIRNFTNNPNKINYAYLLTPKGISQKSKMTINFMKRKMQEYDDLKKELEK